MKTIILFGIYYPEYPRSRVFSGGFKENGWNVLECRADPKKYGGFSKYIQLVKEYKRCRKRMKENDIHGAVVLVAFPGHTVVWLAKILFWRNRIIFDAFLSRFDSNVRDRRSYGPFSRRGIMDWIWDWSSCLLSDRILLDTNEHIKYFSSMFSIRRSKMIRVPISSDTSNFYPRPPRDRTERFLVHFHGMFIPLQGIEYIVSAAEELASEKDIAFDIVGSGQEHLKIKELIEAKKLQNVNMPGVLPLNELPEYVSKADVCLGIFGDTDKAARVVPNKVFEYAAMRKPIITADTPAIREFFVSGKDVLLCDRASGKSIAEAILRLKNDRNLAERLARNAYEAFLSNWAPKTIVSQLIRDIGDTA